jgi:hypothetical protein
MAQNFTGKTQDASSPILGASWWSKGKKIEGTIGREYETKNGTCLEVVLTKPVLVEKKQESRVSIGGLSGIDMAVQAAGADELLRGDMIILECTGETPTDKGNPRKDFQIAIRRP